MHYLDYFPESWQALLACETIRQQLEHTWQAVQEERTQGIAVYPPNAQIFSALATIAPEQVKVVILGQDPYHQKGQAHGYAFSVPFGVTPPPSLKNMYKALQEDYGDFIPPQHGCLTAWAEQGVLLLNTVLTVRDSAAHSHQHLGWQQFTQAVLQYIAAKQAVVFILWGKHAVHSVKGLNLTKHKVLTGVHPSPLSAYRGFFKQAHFKQANEWLKQQGQVPIQWSL